MMVSWCLTTQEEDYSRQSKKKTDQNLSRIKPQSITTETKNHTVNFLDVTFNLEDESYSPYRKPDNDSLYIDSHSNHPRSILKQQPKSINKRILTLSSDNSCFKSTAPFYENTLARSNHRRTGQGRELPP